MDLKSGNKSATTTATGDSQMRIELMGSLPQPG
jgi:hypothetical protein